MAETHPLIDAGSAQTTNAHEAIQMKDDSFVQLLTTKRS
jgi:hypothetical protein